MDSGASFLFLMLLSTIGHISSESIIRLPSENDISGEYCDSWRLAVETNNAGVWKRVPACCARFVEEYVTGEPYSRDSEVIGDLSSAFAKSVRLGGDGRDAWVFDIDETLVSNVPYYKDIGFGSEVFNETSFDHWVNLAEAPALPASLRLYNELQELGFKIFLITGRSEYQRNATETNLLFAGYQNWERLFLRGSSDQGKPAIIYKSQKRAELVNEGYRVHGSSGDQWSDLWGFAVASRSFKLPNPMNSE
ncbi:acid phosphatase 1 isoform X2 [Gastrolobium bilobum]|uniref:acid phosphatase 1 isoform X2 n=1 Tax=Gastrolobium bilobum TaxID=150636 RepID=UPI002AAFB577|nr:acid phosphatase 1 isoform X2 [Gastrolobium bilobum]